MKVVPLEAGEPLVQKRIGFMKDADIRIPDDFDTMFQDEIERMFYGEDE